VHDGSVTAATGAATPAPTRMRRAVFGLVPENSPMYRLHPATRLVLMLTAGVAPLWIYIPEINLAVIVLAVVLLRWARVSIRSLRPFAPLLVTVAVFILFAFTVLDRPEPDEVLIGTVLGRPIAYDSVAFAVQTYFRIIATVAMGLLYFSTNRERDLLIAMRTLRVPFAASYLASLSLRSAGMFMEDVRVVRQAERARGLDVGKLPYLQRLRQYALYMVPLFSMALRRSEEISAALTARGFSLSSLRGKRPDYGLSRFRITPLDVVLMAVLVGGFVLSLVLVFTSDALSMGRSPTYRFVLEAL
jgi:energy-coupling factor transporter transmembrane protein EcfT